MINRRDAYTPNAEGFIYNVRTNLSRIRTAKTLQILCEELLIISVWYSNCLTTNTFGLDSSYVDKYQRVIIMCVRAADVRYNELNGDPR